MALLLSCTCHAKSALKMVMALRQTTERHGTEPPNVTIDQMMDNLNAYLGKRLGLMKCLDARSMASRTQRVEYGPCRTLKGLMERCSA